MEKVKKVKEIRDQAMPPHPLTFQENQSPEHTILLIMTNFLITEAIMETTIIPMMTNFPMEVPTIPMEPMVPMEPTHLTTTPVTLPTVHTAASQMT